MEDTTPPGSLPRLLTAHEVADQTGLPLSRIYELAREEILPSIRLGRAMRFDGATLRAFLSAGGTRNGFRGRAEQ